MLELKQEILEQSTPAKCSFKDDITIAVPVFNEELILEKNVRRLVAYFHSVLPCEWELVIADNASTDKTGEIGRRLAETIDHVRYVYTEKRGVGAALKRAWATSTFDILCYTDVDLPFPLESLIELCQAIYEGNDIAIGSRYVKGGVYKASLGRKILSRLYSYWLKMLFSFKFSDHCGTKAIRKKAFLDLLPLLACDDWFFGTELLVHGKEKRFSIKELPIQAHNDHKRNSKTKLLRTTWNFVRLSLLLKWKLVVRRQTRPVSLARSRILSGKSFVIVTHRFVISPGDEMLPYLRERNANVLYIMHSFADKTDRISSYVTSEPNLPESGGHSIDFKRLPEPLVLVKNSLFNLFWVLRSKRKWDVYIGLDGLSSFSGLILRTLGRVREVVYWSTDFVPDKRFASGIMNAIYREVNKFCLKKCDFAWNLSPRMAEGRAKLLGWSSREFSKQIVVPMGVWSEKNGLIPLERVERHKLVFLGHLLEKQGVQLVLKAVPRIIEKIPDFQFLVIGTGPHEKVLKQMVSDLRIGKYVTFSGLIESHSEIDKLLSHCAIAAAPYDITKDTWTYWADPGKFKSYFAQSLPIILTPVSFNAKEIEQRKCGVLIRYDEDEFAKAVCNLMLNEELLREYRFNAYEYSRKFDWAKIFDYATGTLFR